MNINGDYKKITLAGTETEIKFPRNYPIFGVKGENITVALTAGAVSDTRSTADTDGVVMWAHHKSIDAMYLTGTGDAIVWAGDRAEECPFKVKAKGGGGSGGSGYTLTQLYSMPSGSLSYADITLSQPWTSYDQLLFLMISRDVVSTIRCQVIFDVKSLIDKTPNIFFLLPDEANVGSFVLYMPDAQDNTLLKYTDQHNNFVYVHSVYGIKF